MAGRLMCFIRLTQPAFSQIGIEWPRQRLGRFFRLPGHRLLPPGQEFACSDGRHGLDCDSPVDRIAAFDDTTVNNMGKRSRLGCEENGNSSLSCRDCNLAGIKPAGNQGGRNRGADNFCQNVAALSPFDGELFRCAVRYPRGWLHEWLPMTCPRRCSSATS